MMSAPPQQPLQSVSAFADSDEDNASMDTSDLKSGDIDLDDDTENDDEEDDDNEDEEAIPVASIVASGSLSDDDDADDDDDEKEDDTPDGASKLSSKASADGKKITADNNNNEHPSSSPLSSSGKRKASNDDGQQSSSAAKKQRQPAAKGLFVPFRTVKKIMQQDPDINIIQNDAAIMVTAATGMFLKQFTEKSLESCKKKGRNTIKYDDVAEVRAKNKNYAFLDMLLP